jgi:PAS domain S-box-containing protein
MTADIERYEGLLSMAPLGCLLLESGIIQRANPEAVETMGIPAHRMIGVPLSELLVPDHEESLLELLDHAVNEPLVQTRTRPVRLARGLAPMELLARALTDEVVLIGVRSMASEHRYSAQAGGALTHDLVTGYRTATS